MKKVLALVLAAVMSLGMTTVAFAEEEMNVPENLAIINGNNVTFEKDDKVLVVDLNTMFTEKDDKVNLTSSVSDPIEPGTTLYFPVYGGKYTKTQTTGTILDSGEVKFFSNVSDLKDFRVSYSIDDGKNMVKSAKFVKMNTSNPTGKGLFVALETNDNFIMESQTVDLTLKVSSKNSAWVGERVSSTSVALQENGVVEKNFVHDLAYEENDVSNGFFTVGDKAMVLKFDDDADDVTLCFEEDVEVSGNMKGQKDINVRMKTENDTLEEKYPDATLRLFDGNKDTFKRELNVRMPYEATTEKPFIYEVDAKGNLTKVEAKYDDVAGEFNFKTKTLGNYVISDTELKSVVDNDTNTDAPAEGDKPTDGTEPNPGTGANDFVGLAVALAVVSVAGIAVAKRK